MASEFLTSVTVQEALAKIDSAQNELANQAEVLLDSMSDIIHSLRDYWEEIEFNPKREFL